MTGAYRDFGSRLGLIFTFVTVLNVVRSDKPGLIYTRPDQIPNLKIRLTIKLTIREVFPYKAQMLDEYTGHDFPEYS